MTNYFNPKEKYGLNNGLKLPMKKKAFLRRIGESMTLKRFLA
jgi:hypothetical protein